MNKEAVFVGSYLVQLRYRSSITCNNWFCRFFKFCFGYAFDRGITSIYRRFILVHHRHVKLIYLVHFVTQMFIFGLITWFCWMSKTLMQSSWWIMCNWLFIMILNWISNLSKIMYFSQVLSPTMNFEIVIKWVSNRFNSNSSIRR